MQTNIVGFVGFTQQHDDILNRKEAATITDYLRSILSKSGTDAVTFTTLLQTHTTDYDDPHEVGKSESFMESVYQALYGYYTELSSNPVSYEAFVAMRGSTQWLAFIRSLIVDYQIFKKLQTQQSPATLSPTTDVNQVDPSGSAQSIAFTPGQDIDTFFKGRAGLDNGDLLGDMSALGTAATTDKPIVYATTGLPRLISSTDFLKSFADVSTYDLSGKPFPITVGLRLGVGTAPPDAMVAVLTITTDQGDIVVNYNPTSKQMSITTPWADCPTIGPRDVPTGIVWVMITPSRFILVAQDPSVSANWELTLNAQARSNDRTVDLGTPTDWQKTLTGVNALAGVSKITMQTPVSQANADVAVYALTVFSGNTNLPSVMAQSAYF